MKRLPIFIAIAFTFALTACQNDTTAELDAILDNETLLEEANQLAKLNGAEILDAMADRRTPSCNGRSFNEALAEFVAANQQYANANCQTIKGPIEGCLDGFTTYATGLVIPQASICDQANTGKTFVPANQHEVSQQDGFKVSLTIADCYLSGKSVYTQIATVRGSKYMYRFNWKLDGAPISTLPQVECLTGEMLMLTITQYPGNAQVVRYIPLDDLPDGV